MSQAQLTDYFSTRKLPRGSQALINKEKSVQSVETFQRTTRSRAAKQTPVVIEQVAHVEKEKIVEDKQKVKNEKCKKVIEEVEAVVVSDKTIEEPAPVDKEKKQKLTADELKEKVKNFRQKLQKHNEKFAKKSELEEKKVEKDPPTPAYEKYASLALNDETIKTSNDDEKKLILPSKHQNLIELFKGSDNIVKFLYNRQEVCTYSKLKNGVQSMTKKNISHNVLGQFKTVYPNSYSFKQEKLYIDYKNDYHLTIEPIFEEEITNGERKMTPLLLLERLKIFQNLLIENVKQIHQKFLKSIGVTNIPSNSIKRWHPKFDLEEIEDIIAVELPQKPNEVKLTTGEDLKKIAKEVYSVRVESAIESVLNKQEKIVEIVSAKSQEVPKNATLKEKQSIEYTNLLERIRAKERYKDVEKMILNSDKEKRVQLLEKYGDCVRFVKSYFYAEKKATIDLETVCKKMHDSLKCYTANEYEEIIRELCKDFTKWINIIKVRQQQYVKIDKQIELNELLTKISSMVEEAKA